MYDQKGLRPLRRYVRFGVSVWLDDLKVEATSRNVSIGGMYVLFGVDDLRDKKPTPGAVLRTEFMLPDKPERISTKSKIVWVNNDDRDEMGDKACGMGVTFAKMKPEYHRVVESYVNEFKFTVVTVDKNSSNLKFLRGCLKDDYRLIECKGVSKALEAIKNEDVSAVIISSQIIDSGADDLIRHITRRFPHSHTKAIVLQDRKALEDQQEVVGVPGVFQHVLMPAGDLPIRQVVRNAVEAYDAEKEKDRLQEELIREQGDRIAYLESKTKDASGFDLLIGDDPKLKSAIDQAKDVSTNDITVLILGETGTGKELIANAIHQASSRANGPFVAVNCGAIPENLIESELFGYLKGAFTGATMARQGKILAANGGTILLDEIGELPLQLQSKLLRVLEKKEVTRLGSTKPKPVDVRIIAASNKDLEKEVELDRFRKDLFYRIAVVMINLPPLRERKGDIKILAHKFLVQHCGEFERRVKGIEPDALEMLESYSWPGNIRELRNEIQRLVMTCQSGQIATAEMISKNIRKEARSDLSKIISDPISYLKNLAPTFSKAVLKSGIGIDEATNMVHRIVYEAAQKESNGNLSSAAKMLGIARGTLLSRLKKLGLI